MLHFIHRKYELVYEYLKRLYFICIHPTHTRERLRATTQEPDPLKMPATDAGETSGRRSISRPRFLSPKSKHSNTSTDRESLNQYKKDYLLKKELLKIYEVFRLCYTCYLTQYSD